MLNLIKKSFGNKRLPFLLASLLLIVNVSACSNSGYTGLPFTNTGTTNGSDNANEKTGLSDKKIAVVYFSAFDDIDNAAKEVADKVNGDLIEIVPQVPYTADDFNDNDDSRILLESRLNLFEEETEELVNDYVPSYGIEINETPESTSLPKITELPKIKNINVNRYDVIFIGYPIWYNDAPKVIYTFLKDLKNKTIIPFTSIHNNEKIAPSEATIGNYVDESVEVMLGLELTGTATESEISNWLNLIDLNV